MNKLIIKSTRYNKKFEYHGYLWYRYHRLFFGSLIQRGKKLWAFNFLCNLKLKLKLLERGDPFWVFLLSMMKITPNVLLVPLKLSGVVQGVPVAISERKQYTFAVKWVIKALRDKNRLVTVNTVADVLISAIYGKGISIDKLHAVNRTARINRYLIRFLR